MEVMDVDLEQYYDVVRKYARVAFKKLRKPSINSIEDMESEGMLVLFRVLPKYDPKKYKVNFKTFLIRCLINHYVGEFVPKSYSRHICDAVDVEIIKYQPSGSSDNPLKIVESLDLLSKVSDLELTYINFMLNMPKQIAELLALETDGRKRKPLQRKLICEWLNITENQEQEIRKSIQKTLS